MAFRDVPIKRKLTTVILLTSGIVLLMSSAAFLTYEVVTFRRTMVQDMATLAEIIAANSTAALAFDDEAEAGQILNTLQADRQIEAAALYSSEGALFAVYPADLGESELPAIPGVKGAWFQQGGFIVFEPVVQGDLVLGTLYLRSNLRAMYERLESYGAIVLLILASSFLVAFALSTGMQRSVSRPILELAETARAVSNRRDYTVRAIKQGDDELGQLTDAFNHMLAQIQLGDAALRKSEARFRQLADSMPQIVWSARPDGYIDYYNERWYEFTGYDERFGDEGWLEILHSNDRERLRSRWYESVRSGKAFEIESLFFDRASGHYRWFLGRALPIRGEAGQVVRWFGSWMDIHDLKSAEEEIRRLNAELERRVVARTAELEQANRELEAFTYSVSHDLRAPLRHIDGYAQILQEEFGEVLPDPAREFLFRIRQGSRNMGQLVDDLLNLGRVSKLGISRTGTDLNPLIGEVIIDLGAETTNRRVRWQVAKLPRLFCDRGLIKQVFANLLSNAVKYTRPKPEAVIEVGCFQRDAERIFFVKDNGVGFDMRYSDKLFGLFQRLHRAEDFDGTGVGLVVVQRIIAKHGGRIWAEAELDKGATFYFVIPEH